MNKFIKSVVLCLTLLVLAFTFTACGGEGGDDHIHAFDQEKVASAYLASPATCKAPAKYFKSCTCGEKSTDTFENGTADANSHDWNYNTCTACGEEGNFSLGLAYDINAEDTGWVITGIGDCMDQDIVLPVVEIAIEAFKGNAIKSVKFSKNIKKVGYGAFQTTTVEQFELNEGLVSIGGQAFSSLANLNKIVIPASVTEMDSTVFASVKSTATIYCRASAQPSTWDAGWFAQCSAQLVWGYTGN